MRDKIRKGIVFGIVFVLMFVVFAGIPMNVSAEESGEPEFPQESFEPWNEGINGWSVEGNGTHFKIINSSNLNISLTSSENVYIYLESVPKLVSFFIKADCAATSTAIILSGFEADKTYYRYEDGDLQETFTPQEDGSYSYTQDISTHHHVFIQETQSTIYIRSNGDIDPSTAPITRDGETYTLTENIGESIFIQRPYITLDGNDYLISGSGSYGIYVNGQTGVTITDIEVDGFSSGIVMYSSDSGTINDNTISYCNNYGINIRNSDSSSLSRNTISENEIGLSLGYSKNNILRDNILVSNDYHFSVHGNYIQNIDTSNRVDGKPIYYLQYVSGIEISPATGYNNVGYLGIVNSDLITVKDITLSGNVEGILLASASYITLENLDICNNQVGIFIDKSHYNNININTISNNFNGIDLRSGSHDNTINGNQISNNLKGISNTYCYDNTISWNRISDNNYGIWEDHYSYNENINNNIITGNYFGIYLDSSSTNILRNNNIYSNTANFGVSGVTLLHFTHDIDISNLVDGKPIYYWVDRSYDKIPSDAGYVAVVNSHNIIVEDFTLNYHNYQGIVFAYTTDSLIQNMEVSNNFWGIYLRNSNNNIITGNSIFDNREGVGLYYCDTNSFYENSVSNNRAGAGIHLSFSEYNIVNDNIFSDNGACGLHFSNFNDIVGNTFSNLRNGLNIGYSYSNTISENTFTQQRYKGINMDLSNDNVIYMNTFLNNHQYGIYLLSSIGNIIYHNNVIENGLLNNNKQVYDSTPANNDWHHPDLLEGNYWSDYEGLDDGSGTGKHAIAGDRIGDTLIPHPTTNFDFYPFTEPDVWLNQPPVIVSITGPIDPIPVNSPLTMEGIFTDPDSGDTHTASWDWGDESTSPGTVNENEGKVTGSHKYTTPGVYIITLTVKDAAEESDTETYEQYVVAYDPTGAFITGGGMIDSPAGAYRADTTLTGKAGFGFVSKYQKGKTVPDGNTQFRFHAGDINFQSTNYDWLVVAGARGQFKGTGTINGGGEYGFILTAIDSELTPSTDVDLFRIKIWNKNDSDKVVYDNNYGSSDDADPTTELTHGSIKIHKA